MKRFFLSSLSARLARIKIARLSADGALDEGFNPNANGYVSNVAVQEDGQISSGSAAAPPAVNLNGGSGLVESVVAFPVALIAIGIWRQTHFGVTDNIGSATDTTDFDNDGLVNHIEFAFGLNPTNPASVNLPPLLENGSEVSLAFTTPSGVSGITYAAESSTTLHLEAGP